LKLTVEVNNDFRNQSLQGNSPFALVTHEPVM